MVNISTKILLITLLLTACNQEKELSSKKYFDLKGFSTSLVQDLKTQKPEVTKNWQIGGEHEVKTVRDIDWDKELSLFVDADLNKSAFTNSYEISNNQTLTIYKLKPNESLPVKAMSIKTTLPEDSKDISIKTSTSNYLFETQSDIALKTKNGKLQEYSVFTIQKLFLSKPDTSYIQGNLKY